MAHNFTGMLLLSNDLFSSMNGTIRSRYRIENNPLGILFKLGIVRGVAILTYFFFISFADPSKKVYTRNYPRLQELITLIANYSFVVPIFPRVYCGPHIERITMHPRRDWYATFKVQLCIITS